MGGKWRRKWPCSICGGDVVYDGYAKTVECNCSKHKKRLPMPADTLKMCFEAVL